MGVSSFSQMTLQHSTSFLKYGLNTSLLNLLWKTNKARGCDLKHFTPHPLLMCFHHNVKNIQVAQFKSQYSGSLGGLAEYDYTSPIKFF